MLLDSPGEHSYAYELRFSCVCACELMLLVSQNRYNGNRCVLQKVLAGPGERPYAYEMGTGVSSR